MAKKVQQQYAPFKTTTPKLESYYHNLVTPDDYNDKYDIGVVMDDSKECRAMIQSLVDFQNQQLEKDGHDPIPTLLCLKDEKAKDEVTGKWTEATGRKLLFFKSTDKSRFAVVGPDKRPMDATSISKGDIVRVNGQAAFGYMKGDPYVTLYLNAVQHISGGGAGGVDAFDMEVEEDGDPVGAFSAEGGSSINDLT
jgi:hypothetical protein